MSDKSKIEKLRDILFDQIDRINQDGIDLDSEIARSTAVLELSEKILDTGRLEVQYLQALPDNNEDRFKSEFFSGNQIAPVDEPKQIEKKN